jgi:hypothetical protein
VAVSRHRIGFVTHVEQRQATWDPVRREHEHGLAAFVAPRRRERFRQSLDDPRRRPKLQAELHHFEHGLEAGCARLCRANSQHVAYVDQVIALLMRSGAPATCFVVAYGDLDGRELPLREAVESLLWIGSGFLSCLPGRLALYASEDGSNVYVLMRDD